MENLSAILTIRVTPTAKNNLANLAYQLRRDPTEVARMAIEDALDAAGYSIGRNRDESNDEQAEHDA